MFWHYSLGWNLSPKLDLIENIYHHGLMVVHGNRKLAMKSNLAYHFPSNAGSWSWSEWTILSTKINLELLGPARGGLPVNRKPIRAGEEQRLYDRFCSWMFLTYIDLRLNSRSLWTWKSQIGHKTRDNFLSFFELDIPAACQSCATNEVCDIRKSTAASVIFTPRSLTLWKHMSGYLLSWCENHSQVPTIVPRCLYTNHFP